MSFYIPGGAGYSATTAASQFVQSFWNQTIGQSRNADIWNFMNEQQNIKVTMSLEKIGNRLVGDLAEETAEYLADKPDLAEEYVIVIVDDGLHGREARAYRREDLVADLDGEERERALEKLKDARLLYHDSAKDLPEVDKDDQELVNLAKNTQAFLNRNEKLLNILDRNELNPFTD